MVYNKISLLFHLYKQYKYANKFKKCFVHDTLPFTIQKCIKRKIIHKK